MHRLKLYLLLLLLAAALVFPFTTSSYYLFLINYVLVYGIGIMGLNLIWGYTGLLSLGHPAFVAIGAYTTGLMMLKWDVSYWLALPAGLILSGACAILVGLPVLRLKGHYLAVATLCLAILVEALLVQWQGLTGGSVGLIGLPAPRLFGRDMDQRDLYFFVLLCAVGGWLVVRNLVRSPRGYAFMAIRDSEEAAASVGINTAREKIIVFCVGSMFAGLAGSLHLAVSGYANPQTVASLELLLLYTAAVVIGGSGTMIGPVYGTLFIVLIPEVMAPLKAFRPVIFGLAMAATVLLAPGGFVSLQNVLLRLVRKRIQNRARPVTAYGRTGNTPGK